ncbi:MAG: heparinase II/III family protein [Paracoccaceae bacterium]
MEQASFKARATRAMNRIHARFATRTSLATAFVTAPEPRTIGRFAKGRQLVAGNFVFAGHLLVAPNTDIWDLVPPDPAFEFERQGFAWLDDLASVGDGSARAAGALWLWGWIDRFGKGQGPGWTPDLTGRRLIRWINHALFVLRGQDSARSIAFHQSLVHQTRFLSRRWQVASPGLPRFEALTGLIYASLALEGLEHLAEPAIEALAKECDLQIDSEGGVPTRNPQELLDVFMLLTWASAALQEADLPIPESHLRAIDRIAPSLRTLRHSDGGLARFHGGGRGIDGWLDHALAFSGVRTRTSDGLSMGFARLSAGRTSVVIDAAAPPTGAASTNAHASTLAFELTSGRRPIIVNCGSGASFGGDWRRAGRATPSHSTLSLDGFSSARLGDSDKATAREMLVDAPDHVPVEISEASDGQRFQGGHNGYSKTHGLSHARTLDLTFDGRAMAGEDLLVSLDDADKRRFDKALDATRLSGVPFDVRFHLHPEVDVKLDLGGAAVSLMLKSGEIWVFRSESMPLRLEPSVYLETGRLKPRATQQIVLSGRAVEYATRVRWSLSKPQETAIGVRDLVPDQIDLP